MLHHAHISPHPTLSGTNSDRSTPNRADESSCAGTVLLPDLLIHDISLLRKLLLRGALHPRRCRALRAAARAARAREPSAVFINQANQATHAKKGQAS